LCATPRTGSTFLCDLLTSTGVLGTPESYFREPDEVEWATKFGVPTCGANARNYGRFIRAVISAGTTDNGVFAARVMWGTLDHMLRGLRQPACTSDRDVLERALGPLTFVHLSRENVLAQAVSWARAEQTGYWHEGDTSVHRPEPDVHQMTVLARTIERHDAAWNSWFDNHGISPHRITYEQLVRHPRTIVAGIAAAMDVGIPASWTPESSHRKQADTNSAEWEDLLRAAL